MDKNIRGGKNYKKVLGRVMFSRHGLILASEKQWQQKGMSENSPGYTVRQHLKEEMRERY